MLTATRFRRGGPADGRPDPAVRPRAGAAARFSRADRGAQRLRAARVSAHARQAAPSGAPERRPAPGRSPGTAAPARVRPAHRLKSLFLEGAGHAIFVTTIPPPVR